MNILIAVAVTLIVTGVISFKTGYFLGHQHGWGEGMQRGLRFAKLKNRESNPYEHSRN